MAETDQTKFVTYKALLTSMGSLALIMLIIFGLYVTHMDKKVNLELYMADKQSGQREYSRLCTDIGDIKDRVDSNAKDMFILKRNLEVTMRALKVEPVK